ncbi:MAG TPA: hypothetical protein VHU23_11790 [Rhizomicrobium sp.]|nr:hypothetical protein [Rhizomicrobium sp.]
MNILAVSGGENERYVQRHLPIRGGKTRFIPEIDLKQRERGL